MRHILLITVSLLLSTSCTLLPSYELRKREYCYKIDENTVRCEDGDYETPFDYPLSIYDR